MSAESPLSGSAPMDARFPSQNATAYCYIMFVDYIKCTQLLGKEYEPCNYFKKNYRALCPNAWVERWYQQIEDGTFAHPLPDDK